MNKNVAKIVLNTVYGETNKRFNETNEINGNGLDKNDKLILVILEILNRSRSAELKAVYHGDYKRFKDEKESQKHLEYFLDLLIKPSLVDKLYHEFYENGESENE